MWISAMDDRSKLEKILTIVRDERGNPQIRTVAQRMLDKMQSNTELAINPTCEEAYRRYQETYAGVIQVKVGSITLPKRVRPVAVCNDTQMQKIFKMYATWPDILTAMRRCVGGIGNIILTEAEYLKEWEREVA
jgi:hypothetical protein